MFIFLFVHSSTMATFFKIRKCATCESLIFDDCFDCVKCKTKANELLSQNSSDETDLNILHLPQFEPLHYSSTGEEFRQNYMKYNLVPSLSPLVNISYNVINH